MSEHLVEQPRLEAAKSFDVHEWLDSSDGRVTFPEEFPEATMQRLAKLHEDIPYVGSTTELMEQLKIAINTLPVEEQLDARFYLAGLTPEYLGLPAPRYKRLVEALQSIVNPVQKIVQSREFPPKITPEEKDFNLKCGPYTAKIYAQKRIVATLESLNEHLDEQLGEELIGASLKQAKLAIAGLNKKLEEFKRTYVFEAPPHRERVLGAPSSQDGIPMELSNPADEPKITSHAVSWAEGLRPSEVIKPAEASVQDNDSIKESDTAISESPGKRDSISTDGMDILYKKLREWPLLTAEGEVSLMMEVEAGVLAAEALSTYSDRYTEEDIRGLRILAEQGIRAHEKMVNSNLRLVVSIARRYTNRGLDLMDLIQEGSLGLNHAVEMFDYKMGFKFSTYATRWIKQSIFRALANTGRTIRLPVHVYEDINVLLRVRDELSSELGREATTDEVAKEVGIDVEKVSSLMKWSQKPISLSTPLSDDGDGSFGDLIEDGDAPQMLDSVVSQELREALYSIFDTLSEREATVMKLRFGLTDGRPRTLDEIAPLYGLTRERIRQIEAKTMSKLRHPSRSHLLRPHLRSLFS